MVAEVKRKESTIGSSHKIVVIGLDGATWDLIDPWIKAGHLPVLGNLVARGTRGVLKSTMPPVSPLAWSTFLTGTNPGKHGIYGFIKRQGREYRWRPVTAMDRAGQPLWHHTNLRGLKSAFLYVPLTFPPSPLNGVMISGLGTPGVESDFIYPPELKSELTALFDKHYLIEPLVNEAPEEVLKNMLISIDVQADILRYIMTRDTFSLIVFVFGQTDRAQHFYWKEMDPDNPNHDPATPNVLKGAIQAVYERVDAVIGRICESLDEDTTLIVMSDHGFGPYHRDLYLDNWLAQEGFLAYKDSGARGTYSYLSSRVRKLAYSAIGLVEGRIPQKIVWPLRKFGVLSSLDQFNANPSAAEIDWLGTHVYTADFWGNLYLNLRGREPSGIVEPGQEAEDLLQEVTERLIALRDPETGEPIVKRVYQRTELYTGSHANQSADLIVECTGTYHCKPHPLEEQELIVAPAGKFKHATLDHSAEHRPEGIVLLVGSRIRQGNCLDRANIADLAPTILYLLDCPLSKEFDGTPLIGAVRQASLRDKTQLMHENPSISSTDPSGPGYTDDEAREIEDRLRDLGYL
jgi:predicted AlkP superfamily phosphohydrolase/phosphomutase